ncbi:12765_t:CDS:2, partial [Racocetra persica]
NDVRFAQDQTNINLLNIYDNPFIEWSANFTQGYEDQTNNSLPTEWSMDLTQDLTNTSLPNIYKNPSIEWSAGFSQDQTNNNLPIEWSAGFSQDQTNNNLPIEWSTEFTNNIPFMEWNAVFTQYQANASSLNIYNNSIIESSTGISQKDQTNTTLPNIYGSGITQPCDEQINTLQQQFNVKSVKENEHPVSLIPANVPQDLVILMKSCWHSDPRQRLRDGYCDGYWNLNRLIERAERGEIKFPENKDTSYVPTKINDQAIYSSRSLNLLISKALTLQSMKLSNNTIT